MAKETERKFLVKGDGWRSEATSSKNFVQAYIAAMDDRSVRVRLVDGKRATLTVKIGSTSFSRDEFEYAIPLSDAEELLSSAIGIILEKRRYTVEHEGFTWEVDVYGGVYRGLVVAEVELQDEADTPELPDWIGREVTGDGRYSNMVMATENVSAELRHALSRPAR